MLGARQCGFYVCYESIIIIIYLYEGGAKKTTPKLADLSPTLVYFSVIFSPVAPVLFLTQIFFSPFRVLSSTAGAKGRTDVPGWPGGPALDRRLPPPIRRSGPSSLPPSGTYTPPFIHQHRNNVIVL